MKYIYQNADWRSFKWCEEKITNLLLDIQKAQGYLLGKMDVLGFEVKNNALLNVLTENILKSSEIEGELLNKDQVHSSVARRLGLNYDSSINIERNVEGVVEMMIDATHNFNKQITEERLFGWHAALFPTGYSGMYKIEVGQYRKDKNGPMEVISGSIGKEKIHYEAPEAKYLKNEMNYLIDYINNNHSDNLLIKAAVIHLWFATLHPFEDGNGRIARALTDMILAQQDNSKYRFYSMSSQIKKTRKAYYEILEKTQKGSMDITNWIIWFLETLLEAIKSSEDILSGVLKRAEFWQKHNDLVFNVRQKKVLNRFMDDFQGNLTTTKWAKMCNCSQDTATRDISDLIDKKIFKKIGDGRNTHYKFV
ncbi:MAG: Fic family protein [Candidatus Gastranaerophilales bacterium]|nr:Fic family protein [Candidatus Gastranaerophilales bacterium]